MIKAAVGDDKFDFSLIKQPLHEKKVKGNQANLTR